MTAMQSGLIWHAEQKEAVGSAIPEMLPIEKTIAGLRTVCSIAVDSRLEIIKNPELQEAA